MSRALAMNEMSDTSEGKARRARRGVGPWMALLAVPFVGTLWVPLYNRLEPSAYGVPFFYWYQFAWIGIGAAITAVVYFATREEREEREEREGRDP